MSELPDDKLVERAVRNARPRGGSQRRWCVLMDAFGLGSGYAAQLCRRFNLDPDEFITRNGTVKREKS